MTNRPLSVSLAFVFILLEALFWLAFGGLVVANIHPGLPDLPFIKEIAAFLAFATAGTLVGLFIFLTKHNRSAYFLALGILGAISLLSIFDDFGWPDLTVLIITLVPILLLIKDRAWYLQAKPGPAGIN